MKVLAQVTIPDPASAGLKFTTLGGIFSELLKYAIAFGGMAMFAMIIIGGFALLTAAGDSGKIKRGTDQILFGIIGFLIIFATYWLLQIVELVFDIPVF